MPADFYCDMEQRLLNNSVIGVNCASHMADPDCWLWTGRRVRSRQGSVYGRLNVWMRKVKRVVTVMAHRLSYEQFKGPIPPDYVVDHLCRNQICINPAHLEAVPESVNLARRQYG